MSELANMSIGLWYGPSDFKGKLQAEIADTIRSKQLYAAALIWINLVLCILSIFIELVPGYALGGGAAGVTWSALPHGVWQTANFFVLALALQSIYFDSNLDVASAVSSQTVAMWLMLVACIVNIVNLTSICFEVNNTNSTFWLQSGGAWVWVVLIGLVVFILWGPWIAWRLHSLRIDVGKAHYDYGWMPGRGATYSSEAPEPPPADVERRIGGRFSASPATAAAARSVTVSPAAQAIHVPATRVGNAYVATDKTK